VSRLAPEAHALKRRVEAAAERKAARAV